MLRNDVKAVIESVDRSVIDPLIKQLLIDEILPLFNTASSLIEKQRERLDEHDDIITDLIASEGDMIHPELAAIIINALRAGDALCDFIIMKGVSAGDDIANKKLAELLSDFKTKAIEAVKEVMDVVVEDDEDNNDDEAGEEDGDGDDERDGDGDDTDGEPAAEEEEG